MYGKVLERFKRTTDEENESYQLQRVVYKSKKEFNTVEFDTDENDKNEFSADENDKDKFKLYHKVRDFSHHTRKFWGVAHNIWKLRYKTLKKESSNIS